MAITPTATSAIRFNVQETNVFSAALNDNKGRYKTLSKAAMEAEAIQDKKTFEGSAALMGYRSIEEYLLKNSPFKTFKLNENGFYTHSGNKTLILFTDPNTQERMLMQITNENLDKLKSKFDKSNFYYREDGITRITGEAEELLGGWLQEIAYNQGYAEADKNNDSIIDLLDDENANLKTGVRQALGYKMQNGKIVEIFAKETKSYLQGNDIFLAQSGKTERTFEERFNNFIEKDEDLDGEMTNIEYFGGKEKMIEHFQAIQQAQVQDKEELIETLESAIEAEHAFAELSKHKESFRLSVSQREALSNAAPIYARGFKKGEIFNDAEMSYIRNHLDENVAKLLQLGGNQASLPDIVQHVHAVYLAEDENNKERPIVQQLQTFLDMVKTDSVGSGTTVNLIA